jgi:hypothetical protein
LNQKTSKPLQEFTQKQRKAYKTVMKALADKKMTRRQLFRLIKNSEIYTQERDCKEIIRMLIQNPNTPISLNSEGKVQNELAVIESA